MDTFFEQVIRRKDNKKTTILKIIIAILTFLLCNFIFSNIFLKTGTYGLLIYVVGALVLFFKFRATSFEFEYIFTNGELDIDRIIAKKKRVSLVNVNIRNIDNFGKVTDLSLEERNNPTLPCIYAHDGIRENIHFIEFKYLNDEMTRLYFSPNEDILSAIRRYLPVSIKKQEAQKISQ